MFTKEFETEVGVLHMICADGERKESPLSISASKRDDGSWAYQSLGEEIDFVLDCYYEATGACVEDWPKRIVKMEILLHTLTHQNAPGIDPAHPEEGTM